MTTKKKKSAKQRRVLIVALIVAVAIVAASTFAWFSSKDEVTNRLTASANYNVSIVEDFQPPADWLPGQTINKDVAAVNTGNVDAFVRMWLDGQMRLLSEVTDSDSMVDVVGLGSLDGVVEEVTDPARTKLGLNYYTKTGDVITYYKTLSKEQIDNPLDGNHETSANEETNEPAKFSEVQSMQAAGVLVYAPTGAKYTWTLEQGTDLWVYSGANAEPTYKNIAKGTTVGSVSSTATTKIAGGSTAATAGGNYYGAIDASTFKPATTGLYLFRRALYDTADGTANEYEYSGYYYDVDLDEYFALYTDEGDITNSDYVLPAGAVTEDNTTDVPTSNLTLPVSVAAGKVFLSTATETLVDDGLAWVYDINNTKFTVTYDNGDKDIVIDIALANIGSGTEQWTAITAAGGTTPGKTTTFYYTNDLEAGDTTRKLVDSVTLSQDTEVGAYLAFDFDLDVFLDSVQVTLDEAGVEGYASVNPWAKSEPNNPDGENIGAIGSDNGTRVNASEIEKIYWSRSNS